MLSRLIIAGLLALLLAGCNLRMYIDQDPQDAGRSLANGESASFRFFTSDPAAESGVNLARDATYRLQVSMVSNWSDGTILADRDGGQIGPRGFGDDLMPYRGLSLLKRSRQHNWFELMIYQDGCRSQSLRGVTDLDYDAGSDSYSFRAACSGDLKLFVNDGQGFYVNNSGMANMTITRSN